jgi:CelD/BcsL family acetyltransferase involved in cellulose biosynthesis/RimJ/RimL family protein N-acetyltransferase
LKVGADALAFLSDRTTAPEWDRLRAACPWASVFQSFPVVDAWYRLYAERFQPVVVVSRDSTARMTGVLALATPAGSATGSLVGAGDIHAEYQPWLSTPERGASFIEGALETIAAASRFPSLRLAFLSSAVPLDWVREGSSRWSPYAELREFPSGFMEVGPESECAATLKKKRYRSRLKWLERDGEVRFERITEPARLGALLDEFTILCDLRQAAVNDSMPFHGDALKRPLHEQWFDPLRILHVTELRAGPHLVSAQLNILDAGGSRLLLGVIGHAPRYAKYSPGTLHVLLLGDLIAREGMKELDLSPGGEYKDRFASRSEPAYSLSVRFSTTSARAAAIGRRIRTSAVRAARSAGITPERQERLISVARRMARPPVYRLPLAAGRRVRRACWEDIELRLYTHDLRTLPELPAPGHQRVTCDRIPDLLTYAPWDAAAPSRREFLATALERLERGEHAYTVIDGAHVVHIGWLIERQERAQFDEVGQTYTPRSDATVLYDFVTHPSARGRGLYRESLTRMLHDSVTTFAARAAHIAVRADNAPSRHVIESLGFTHEASFYMKRRFGRVRRWNTADPATQAPAEVVVQPQPEPR